METRERAITKRRGVKIREKVDNKVRKKEKKYGHKRMKGQSEEKRKK